MNSTTRSIPHSGERRVRSTGSDEGLTVWEERVLPNQLTHSVWMAGGKSIQELLKTTWQIDDCRHVGRAEHAHADCGYRPELHQLLEPGCRTIEKLVGQQGWKQAAHAMSLRFRGRFA